MTQLPTMSLELVEREREKEREGSDRVRAETKKRGSVGLNLRAYFPNSSTVLSSKGIVDL